MSHFRNEDPYKLLEIKRDATPKQIKAAFRKQALKWHPDKAKSDEDREAAEAHFKKIVWAYDKVSVGSNSTEYKEFWQFNSRDYDSPNFNFSEFWEHWQSRHGSDIFEEGEDIPLPEENKAKIKQMWEEEDKLTEEERLARCTVTVLDPDECIVRWHQYISQVTTEAGVGESGAYSVNDAFNKKIACWKGTLVKLKLDAIANAANTYLAGGGGVDGAIHCAAGEKIYDECDLYENGCSIGKAVITRGYNLPAKYVIHCCGPTQQKPEKLSSCYTSALNIAVEHKIRSIAFPCISTGVYGYPLEAAVNVVLCTVRKWLETDNNADHIDLIVFSCFRDKEITLYEKWMQWYFPASIHLDAPQVKIEETKTESQTDQKRDKAEYFFGV